MTDQFQTIAAAFAGAVLSQLHRPLRLRWRGQETHFAQWLLVQQVDIQEACLEGLQAKLTCVSSDPELPLQALLGQPLGIEMVTDRGGLHHTNGIITEARAGQADGALRVYQLTLKDALSIMEERINTRVFRQMSVPRILEIMLGEWRQRSPALATAFHFDLDGLEDRRYPMREISHQFNESDAHFIRRLCRREGIAWYVASPQPAANTGRTAHADVPMHTLVFCDQSALLPRALAGTVRYHREGATEERDTISAWSRQRSLVPGRVWRGSWDYKAVRLEEAASHSAIDQGDTGRALAAILNDGLIEAPHAADGQQDHLRLADARMLAHEGRSESFEASGTVRDLAVGHWFELEGHPDMHGQDRTLREFIVTSLRQQAENNFPKALQDAIDRLLPASTWQADVQGAADMRYRNQLSCCRRSAPLAPHYDPRLHLPAVHPVTALVVGPANEEVYCDELGRIKVQLQGLHVEDHVHAQGAGTSGQERDSAFVRVSSAWAGAGYGHDAVPRVGMEVLIDFLGGDPDKMFVAGVLHNGINHPARFSHSGGLPGNRFLSGIKSKEIEGARYNQLRLDDTPGQISTQLASEHQHSQMNLGYLTEPRHDGRGDGRGEGLEARTDGHGVLRGAKGILITAQAQDGGRGRMLEREAQLDTLRSLAELAQRLSQDAARHHAEATDLAQLERIREQLQSWDTSEAAGGTRHAAAPMVALDAPAGVSVTSQDTMVLGASRHIDLVSRDNTQLNAGRKLLMRAGEMFAAFAGKHMKLISGKGSVKVQAHEEHVELQAARRILLEASEEIILQAPKISIRSRDDTQIHGGGSFSRWNASLIEHGTSGQWRQQAAEHNVLGPANCPPPEIAPPPTYEDLQQSGSLLVRLRSHARDGRPLAHQPYTLFKQGAQIAVGVTDAAGRLRIEGHQPGDDSYSVKLPNGYCFDLPVHEQISALDQQLAASGWGDLLREVAAGKYNNGSPVNVRVLCWNEGMISTMAKNTPGYDELDAKKLKSIRDKERLSGKPHEAGLTPQERRSYFNALWFFEATHGTQAHLTFKVRAGNADKVRESLKEEKSTKLTITEHHSLVQASTAHQKTILIDYAHANGEHAVGYVMGLNSVTDYWDTRRHLFHDPRRGAAWEGGGDALPGLKPFQDYACRICGEALISVSKNFVDAWNRVATADQKIQRVHDLRSPPAGLKTRASSPTGMATNNL